MNFEEFQQSVRSEETPPAGIDAALAALWWDGKGDWEKAHALAKDAGSREGDWVHAYLHRKEGDEGNARYWYARSRKPFFAGGLEEEWAVMASELLGG